MALYLTEVRRFATWLAEHDRFEGGDLVAVTKRDVEAWIGVMRAKGLVQATIMRRCGESRAVDRAPDAYDNVNPMGDR